MKRTLPALLALGLAGSCGDESLPPTATAAVAAYCGADYVDVERRIDALLARMTLDDKIAMVHGGGLTPPIWQGGGVPELGIPMFAMVDGPRGVSKMLGANATAFPVAMARGATFDPELEHRIGEAIGREARASARNVLLAPTVNVLRHPRWGRAQETYGEDPYHIGRMGVGFVQGAQTQLPVTVKHFAVNSIENTRLEVDVTVDERTLREIYLPHFERIVRDAHVAGVMSAYNSVNGEYCSENSHLLRDILKTDWEYPGFVVSDWGGTQQNTPGTHDHTVAAANAGLDLEMFAANLYEADLYLAVSGGELPEARVDEMVRRLLRARFCFDLDVNPPVADPSAIETQATRAIAREAAERSFVLLQNQSDALPITRSSGLQIVVTGPLADVENLGDTGSSAVTSTDVVTALEGLTAAAGAATVTHLATPPTTTADQNAITAADVVVIVAGLTAADEGEAQLGAGDRDSLTLPADQVQWISDVAALSNRVVLVLEGGSAITLGSTLGEVEAVLMAWYPGLDGGTALANVLYGDVAPSGRLPIVFPVDEADLQPFDNVSTSVTYGYLHGYRYLDDQGTAPGFPFGFGLTYTTFGYANLVAPTASLRANDTIHVTVDVSNTGARAGRETVQLYVGAPNSTVTPRALRDLRAFTQVVLAPGETRNVALDVPVRELATWSTTSHAWVVEPTTYRIEVGSSSRDLPLTADVVVTP